MNCQEYKENYNKLSEDANTNYIDESLLQAFYKHECECTNCQVWGKEQQCYKKGINPSNHCCLTMAYNICHGVNDEEGNLHEFIHYFGEWNEYRLNGPVATLIDYCPWCGKQLPESKQDLWYQTLYSLGYNDPGNQ